ncbi:MAG: sigma-70 family RNA polymerase sigma factor, partial [Phycisphaerae bacterium]|nr:sigma-70 family RNA polymerase sigma factor [Phycisphaerae bacterium]
MPASDATLVQGVLSGDRDAFAELYDRWAGLIRATCFDTTRDLDTAEDLAQEVFLRALQKLGNLRDPRRFVAWLMGIARLDGLRAYPEQIKALFGERFVDHLPRLMEQMEQEWPDDPKAAQARALLSDV